MKKFLLAKVLLIVTPLASCIKDPEPTVVISRPDFLTGTWVRFETTSPSDTLEITLDFQKAGAYHFTEYHIPSGIEAYREGGSWEMQHLDLDGNEVLDAGEEKKLRLRVITSDTPENVGKIDFLPFEVINDDSIPALKITLFEENSLTFQKQ